MSRRSRRRRTERPSATFPTHHPRSLTPLLVPYALRSDLREVEDRRTYHPEFEFRPARTVWGHPVRPNRVKEVRPARPAFRSPGLGARVRFAVPARTVICVRRNQRKEVLHALKKTGKRGASRSRRRRNYFSAISC